jgi:hypothetical protein
MVLSLDGHSCFICGHIDYGPVFKPLELTVAEARLLELPPMEGKRSTRSAYRRNDQLDINVRLKGRPRYLYRPLRLSNGLSATDDARAVAL